MTGIYGLGRIGKTTLAKFIYNELPRTFKSCRFLLDVLEIAHRHGLQYLHNQLISDILQSKYQVSKVDDGINIIKSKFKGKKVLILLDDVDHKNQLDVLTREHGCFIMPGSMIIVTTRYEVILDKTVFGVDYKYELKELDEVQSLHLFSRHAFHNDYPPSAFEDISHDVISTTAGLPLALEVIGSYLYMKSNMILWKDVLKILTKEPH
ncbi:disease resistance protein RUN1-like [Syzygium oleosum]|uniref:disease resistance protein RUN1-like n=1 Tax=Syzygium oleosum TaxID=219896 RepID=UPI0011D24DDD|nr:disease resistance protein RUN1-like [Syzygium oleosum]